MRNIHVLPQVGGWIVEAEGCPVPRQKFRSEQEAMAAGLEFAKQQHADLIVHGRYGEILRRKSFELGCGSGRQTARG